MKTNLFASLSALSDHDLLERVRSLTAREREATAALVAHLAELDERKLYLGEGYSSLFAYCTGALHLSEGEAGNRIEAARAARRFPVILERLAEGSLHLTAVRLLAPHLTAENHERALESARHKTKREVEVLVAALCPRPDVRSTVRRLPSPPPVPAAASALAPPLLASAAMVQTVPLPPPPSPPRAAPVIAPLAPERYKLQFTVDETTHALLRRAQDLLRHQIPDGDLAAIFTRALALLVGDVEKKKLAKTDRPRKPALPDPDSRHIPAEVRRQVWARDGQQCAFIGRDGHRCTETGRLELHHLHPEALDGPSTLSNLEVRCRAHNVYEAELIFGPRPPMALCERSAPCLVHEHVPEHVPIHHAEAAAEPATQST
jgi:hypothetical protein